MLIAKGIDKSSSIFKGYYKNLCFQHLYAECNTSHYKWGWEWTPSILGNYRPSTAGLIASECTCTFYISEIKRSKSMVFMISLTDSFVTACCWAPLSGRAARRICREDFEMPFSMSLKHHICFLVRDFHLAGMVDKVNKERIWQELNPALPFAVCLHRFLFFILQRIINMKCTVTTIS